jgi:hypothetical protein
MFTTRLVLGLGPAGVADGNGDGDGEVVADELVPYDDGVIAREPLLRHVSP